MLLKVYSINVEKVHEPQPRERSATSSRACFAQTDLIRVHLDCQSVVNP